MKRGKGRFDAVFWREEERCVAHLELAQALLHKGDFFFNVSFGKHHLEERGGGGRSLAEKFSMNVKCQKNLEVTLRRHIETRR